MTRYNYGPYGKGAYGGSGSESLSGQTLIEKLPNTFPLHQNDADFKKWIDAHQYRINTERERLNEIQESFQVDHAQGHHLDLIGSDFGTLGRRRGRNDDQYRRYLKSLVRAFGGRGTVKDLEFAIMSALTLEREDVDILEDFQNNEYQIRLWRWTAHDSGTVEELAELTDPAAIPLIEPLIYKVPYGEFNGEGYDVTSWISGTGLSSSDLAPLSNSGGWNLG